jgi:hypothetical protein
VSSDKNKKDKKDKKEGKAEAADATQVQASASEAQGGHPIKISEHPKASRFVRQAREAAGLGGFLIGGWMSLSTHTLAATLLRAIVAGFACQIVVWAVAVLLCRHLIIAELRSREHALMQAAAAKMEAAGRGALPPAGQRAGAAAAGRGGRRP